MGTNKSETPGSQQAAQQAAPKSWIQRWSDLTSGFRTLAMNVGVFALALLLVYIYMYRDPPTIVIGNIDVNDFGPSTAIKSEDLHTLITQAFRDAYRLGGDAMPEEVVASAIEDEENQLDFEIPEIGLSFSKLINFLPKILGHDGNANVTGKLAPTDQGEYSLKAALTDRGGTVGYEGTDPSLDLLLLKAASALLRTRNPYVYASGLSVQERINCYADRRNCDFPRATLAYESIYENAFTEKPSHPGLSGLLHSDKGHYYARWALLAVSKIHEDQSDYAGEIELAKRATVESPNFSWGYYNWGVALAELGCYSGAISAFSQTILLQPTYQAAYNARGRIHLFLAESLFQSANSIWRSEQQKAVHDFQTALSLNTDYAEAQINLGKAYRMDAMEHRLARVQFEAVIEVPNSPHAARAYQQLAILERMQGDDAKYLDDMGSARHVMASNTVCGFNFSSSLRDASGCMEPPAKQRLPDLSSSLACRRHSEDLPVAGVDKL